MSPSLPAVSLLSIDCRAHPTSIISSSPTSSSACTKEEKKSRGEHGKWQVLCPFTMADPRSRMRGCRTILDILRHQSLRFAAARFSLFGRPGLFGKFSFDHITWLSFAFLARIRHSRLRGRLRSCLPLSRSASAPN